MTDTGAETAVVTPEANAEKLAHQRSFIRELAKQDTGRLAVLRRNAGNTLSEARGVAWFYGLLGRYAKPWNEEVYFLIATLFASDKKAISDSIDGKDSLDRGDFGATLRALRNPPGASASDSSPLDRRFNTLLDAGFDPANGGELPFRLRQMTKRIIAEKNAAVRINWPMLLHDIQFWNGVKKLTQSRWARSYYAPVLNSTENTELEPSHE